MANKTNGSNLEGLLKEVLKRIDSLQTEVNTSRETIQFYNQSAKDAGFTDVPAYFNSFLNTDSSHSIDQSVAEWAQTTLADYDKAIKTVEATEKKIATTKKNFAKKLSDMRYEADGNADLIRQFARDHQSDFDMLGLGTIGNVKTHTKKTTTNNNQRPSLSPQVSLGRRQQFFNPSNPSDYYAIDFNPVDAFSDLTDKRQAEYERVSEELDKAMSDTRNLVGRSKTKRDEQIKDLTRKQNAIKSWMKESDVYTSTTISSSFDDEIFSPSFYATTKKNPHTYIGPKTLPKYLDAYKAHSGNEGAAIRQKIVDTLKTAVHEDVYGNYSMMLANQMHRYNRGEGFDDVDLRVAAQSMIQEVIAGLPQALQEYITLGRDGLQDQNNVDASTVSSANRAYQLSNPVHAKTGMELWSLISERNARYRNINSAKEMFGNSKSAYVKSLGLKFPTLAKYRKDVSEGKQDSRRKFMKDNTDILNNLDNLRSATDLMQVTSKDLLRGRRDAQQLLESEDITAEERQMAEQFISDSLEFSQMVKNLTAPLSGYAFSKMTGSKAKLEQLKKSNASPKKIKAAEAKLQQAKTQHEVMYNWQNTLNSSLGVTGGAEESMQVLSAILTSPMITDYGVKKALADRGISQRGSAAVNSYKKAVFSDKVLNADTAMHDIYDIAQGILAKDGFGDFLPSDVQAIADGRPVTTDMDPGTFVKNQKQLPGLLKNIYEQVGLRFKGTKDEMGNFVFDKRMPGHYQVNEFMRALDTVIKSTDGNFDANGRNALLEAWYSQHNTHGLTFNEETGEFKNTILPDADNDPFAYYEPSKVRNQLGNKVGIGTSGNYAADNLSNKENYVEYGTIPWANDEMIKDKGLTDDSKAIAAAKGIGSSNKSIAKSFRGELEGLWSNLSDDIRSSIADDLLDSGKIMSKGKIKNASTKEVLDGIINGTLDSVSMGAQERYLTNLEWESKQPSSKVLNQEGTLNFMLDDIHNNKLGYTKGLMSLRESDPEGFEILAKMLYNNTPVAQLTSRSSSQIADIFKTVWTGDGAELTAEQSRLINEYVDGTSRNKQFDRATLERMTQAKSALEQRKSQIADNKETEQIQSIKNADNMLDLKHPLQPILDTITQFNADNGSVSKGMFRSERLLKGVINGEVDDVEGIKSLYQMRDDINSVRQKHPDLDVSMLDNLFDVGVKYYDNKGYKRLHFNQTSSVNMHKTFDPNFDESEDGGAWIEKTQRPMIFGPDGTPLFQGQYDYKAGYNKNSKNYQGPNIAPQDTDTSSNNQDIKKILTDRLQDDSLQKSFQEKNKQSDIDYTQSLLHRLKNGFDPSRYQLLGTTPEQAERLQLAEDNKFIKGILGDNVEDITGYGTGYSGIVQRLEQKLSSLQQDDASNKAAKPIATPQDTDTSSVDKLISTEEQIQATTNNTAATQNNTQAEISSGVNDAESPKMQSTQTPQVTSTVSTSGSVSSTTSQDLTLDKLPIVQSDDFANDHTYYDAATGEKVMSITQLRDQLLGKSNPTFARDLNYIKSAADALGDGEVLTADMVGSNPKDFNFLKGVIGSGLKGDLFHESVDAIFNYNKANPNAMIKTIAELQGKDDAAYQKIMDKTTATKAQLTKYGFEDDYLTTDQDIASYMEAVDKLGLKPTGFSERPLGFQMMGPNGLFKVAATLDQLYSGEMGLPFTLDNKTGSVKGFESFQLTGQMLAMMANQADISELAGMDFTKGKMGIADVKNGFTKILPYDALSPEAMYELIGRAYGIQNGTAQPLDQSEINRYNTQRQTGVVTGGTGPTPKGYTPIDEIQSYLSSGKQTQQSNAQLLKLQESMNQYGSLMNKSQNQALNPKEIMQLSDLMSTITSLRQTFSTMDSTNPFATVANKMFTQFDNMGTSAAIGGDISQLMYGTISKDFSKQPNVEALKGHINTLATLKNKQLLGEQLTDDQVSQVFDAQNAIKTAQSNISNGSLAGDELSATRELLIMWNQIRQSVEGVKGQVSEYTSLTNQALSVDKQIYAIKAKIATEGRSATQAEQDKLTELQKQKAEIESQRAGMKKDATPKFLESARNIDAKYGVSQSDAQDKAMVQAPILVEQEKQELLKQQKVAMSSSLKSQTAYNNAELNILRANKALEAAQKSGNAEAIAGAQQQLEGAREQAAIASQYKPSFTMNEDGTGTLKTFNQETQQWQETNLARAQALKYQTELNMQTAKHQQALGRVNSNVKTMGSLIGEVLGGMKQTVQYLMRTSIVYAVIGKVKQAFATLIQTTQQLNKSYVDLRIASGQTDGQMKDSMKIYNQMAKEMGKTTQEVANAANDWLRAGYNAEESAKLIKNSMQLSTVGMIDSAKATEYLISTMKGWKLGVDDMEGVVDKLAELDRNEINNMAYCGNSKSYPLNCWEILKLDKLQRNDEIYVNVICDESRKNYQDDTRLKPKCYYNRCSAAKLRTEESSTINRLVSGVGMKANVIPKRWASERAMI